MANISLRAYNREIENLIEKGAIEEAIGHAKQILRSYPKCIETYRLLGKAFLESHRYTEASDILQRVLSVIPDDFIAQIGMSIIREDEGNLDAAIWHMERAFEVQPANIAVQDELRRLYGRRDGAEPPKVRLTSGGLIRMYVRGELLGQAISEVLSVLKDDPKRHDLEVILARMYALTDQKQKSIQTAYNLVAKLPYCYEANRLLAELLPETGKDEEARLHLRRIQAIDPYEAFVNPGAPTAGDVPDQTVMIEKTEVRGQTAESASPEWTKTIGIAWEESTDETPDWLKGEAPGEVPPVLPAEAPEDAAPDLAVGLAGLTAGGVSTSDELTPMEQLAQFDNDQPAAASTEDIPDWLSSAGWAQATGPELPPEPISEALPPSGEGELAPAEIPDWLKSIAPQEPQAQDESTELESLKSIFNDAAPVNDFATEQEVSPASSEELPDWLELAENAESTGDSHVGVTDFLISLRQSNSDEGPDLSDALLAEPLIENDAAQSDEAVANLFEEPPANQSVSEELPAPSWPAQSGAEVPPQSPADSLPDWLQEVVDSPQQPLTEQSAVPQDGPAAEITGVFEEINLQGDSTPAPVQESSEDLPDWLISEIGGAPAALEEIQAPPADNPTPDWLNELTSDQPTIESAGGMPDQNLLDGMGEFITSPAVQAQPDLIAEELTGDSQETVGKVDLPEWLSEEALTPEANVEPQAAAAQSDLPDWLREAEASIDAVELETPTAQEPTPQSAVNTPPADFDMESALAWMEGLAEKQGAESETLFTAKEDRLDQPPAWLVESDSTAEEQPIGQIQSEIAEPAPSTPSPEVSLPPVPDWLEHLHSESRNGSAPVIEEPILPTEEVGAEVAQADTLIYPQEDIHAAVGASELEKGFVSLESGLDTPQAPSAGVPIAAEPDSQLHEPADEPTVVLAPAEALTDEAPLPIPTEPEPIQAETVQPSPSAVDTAGGGLEDARAFLLQSQILPAVEILGEQIRGGKELAAVIDELQQALVRFPVDISLLQTLGDAYLRNDQLREALDAYSKAEALLK